MTEPTELLAALPVLRDVAETAAQSAIQARQRAEELDAAVPPRAR